MKQNKKVALLDVSDDSEADFINQESDEVPLEELQKMLQKVKEEGQVKSMAGRSPSDNEEEDEESDDSAEL